MTDATSRIRFHNSGIVHARSGVSHVATAARSPQLLWWVWCAASIVHSVAPYRSDRLITGAALFLLDMYYVAVNTFVTLVDNMVYFVYGFVPKKIGIVCMIAMLNFRQL